MNWRTFIIASATVLMGVMAGLIVKSPSVADAVSMSAAMSAIKDCEKQSNMITCTRPVIDKLLTVADVSDIMNALQANFTPEECHYVGHVVGQQAYIKSKSLEDTLGRCNRACDSACVHGAIGEVFAEEIGLGTPEDDQNVDLEHLSISEMRTLGSPLCKNEEACHGVGHAIFQSTHDMSKAMSVCDSLATNNTSSCFNGAAMEYADILASRNMRDVPGVKLPDLNTLTEVCTKLPNIIEIRSCFRYYPRMAIETFKSQGLTEKQGYNKVKDICASYQKSTLQTACFLWIGAYNAYDVVTNQDKGISACQGLSGGTQNQAACYFGEIAVGVTERQDTLMQYCAKMPSDAFTRECYQITFYYLQKFGTMTSSTRECANDHALCEQGYQDRFVLPWDLIERNFSK